VDLDNGHNFFVEYYNGTMWQIVKTYTQGADFVNDQFYHEIVWINATTEEAGGNGVNWSIWNNTNNPDSDYMNGGWNWTFDFPNGTGYYEFYSIGNKSGSPNETAPGSADAICYYNTSINNPPTQNNENPAHQSSEISLTPKLKITVNDGDLDTINVTWWSNSSGSWIQFGSNLSIDTSSGPVNIIQTNTNFSYYLTTYWWSINITDGLVWTNETYYFTTEPINTSVDTIIPYIVTESPKTINSTGPSGLENVSLWYQYSTNNFSWWNSNWGYRKLITVDSSQVESDLINFPMLVYNSSDTDLVNYAQSDGDDITFILYSDNTTKLNHEIALYNNSSGELAAWVNVTDLNSSIDTKIWMYYNNSACSSQENVTGTWNSDYEIIWHLQEEGNGTTDEYNDSSKNSCHGTGGKDDDSGGLGNITETPDRINGKFGYAQDFNVDGDTGDRISSQDLSSAWTAVTGSVWIYGNAAGDDRLWGKTFGTADNAHTMVMNCIGTGANTLGCRFQTDIQNTPNYQPASMENDAWIYMVLTWDGSDDDLVRIYKNGQFQGSISVSGTTLYDSPPHEFFTLGNNGDGAANRCFDGYIQEARMSSIRRNYDWIETEYNNQNNLTTFLNFDNNEKINFSWMLWNNATNPDTNSPWSWSFDFPNGTGYYEFYSIGNKSGSPNETAPFNADANCYYLYVNNLPTQSYQLIWDNFSAFLLNNTDIRLNPISLNVTISDLEGSNMNITILTNESGAWNIVNQSSGSGLSNGPYSFTNTSWIDTYNKKYFISFNLTDGIDWTNQTYNFTTITQPPGGKPFIKNSTFGTNFGIQNWNETNSTYFWNYIHYYADIAVEESSDNSTWYRNDTTLTINRNKNSDEEKEKETYNFTAPKYGYYRIVIYFRKPLLNYWDNSSFYEYSLLCEANSTENYSFYFNWSDYVSSYEATITTSKYGVTTKNGSDYFYWIVTINDPLNADETFQIDPTFGDENEGTSGDNLEDTIRGSKFQMPENGNANSISAYLYYKTSGPNFYSVKAAIYNNNSDFLGSTEERSLSNTGGVATWETFTFSSSPFLTANENYYLVIWADSPSGSNDMELRYSLGVNNNNYSSQSYGAWPSSVSLLDESGTFQYNIYCSYTPNNLSVISFPGPANESSGIFPRPICNVTVYDQDGGTVDVYFYENTTGDDIWVLQQTNSSVDVTSAANVEWDNYTNVTVESTKYWWRVVVIDENGGTVEDYYNFITVGISVSINPATWHQGVLTVGSSNETTAFYFELTNSGSIDIDLQIKATNATNATTGAKWKLNDTVGLDNYSLQYNLSDGGTTWTNINLTYDTFVNNLGSSSSKTFDLKLILATLSSKSDPLQITLTFRSVLS
jgi:hypothetical protein